MSAKKPTKKAKKAAKSARKSAKANTPAKAAKPAKAKREAPPAFEMVPLPAHVTTPGGAEIEATERAIIVSEGLREVIFDPLSAYYFDRTWTEADGEKLPEPIPAGSVAIRRGDILRIITPDLKNVVNAIMSARAAALARKRAAKAEREGPRHD